MFGKSARIKISCQLGCFYRARIGVAGHGCFNWGLLTRCQYLFRMLLIDCVVLSNGTKKELNDGMLLLLLTRTDFVLSQSASLFTSVRLTNHIT